MNPSRPLALLFPGQGTEAVGMSAGWQGVEAWNLTVEAAERRTGHPLRRWMAEGPPAELARQRHAPHAVMAHSLGVFLAHRAMGMPLPAAATGHSLGFYSAVAAAGVVEPGVIHDLVEVMEDLCEQTFGEGTHGMAFFIGATELELRQALSGHPELALSNVNGQAQFTVSGPREPLERLVEIMAPKALKAGFLPVRHPMHGIHIVPLVPALTRRLSGVKPKPPAFPLLCHTSGQRLTGAQEIWDEALVSAAQPVHWLRVVAGLKVLDADLCECGFGTQITNLTRWADRNLQIDSLQEPPRPGRWG